MATKETKMSPINDRKGIGSYVKRELKKLEEAKKRARICWTVITSLVGLCNISIVVIAIYALIGISLRKVGADILVPASLVCLITIALFFMGFVLALYQNFKQDHKYKRAIDTIQNEYMKYKSSSYVYEGISEEEGMKLLKSQIQDDLLNIFEVKKKPSASKIIIKTLIGDKDE
ncbi:hypothetical protein [Mycoplasma todarodis]|uniref:DUF4231 domain-containing protein n=1 Tax=Mycoplasma todarodis TaxID=1937191 RepID=A0A4R0XIP7_9MOLU|nr:hypothetical protein [Mycoplasma todarodis]TCG10453.1 hypothetical protein C4B25_04145 [Mycoplasma todarodis]